MRSRVGAEVLIKSENSQSANPSIRLLLLGTSPICPFFPKPDYRPSFWQFNAHMQTIFPSLLRKVKFKYQQRERLELPDGDFVDLDWKQVSPENKRAGHHYPWP
jgi:hypothetical protein